MTYDELVTAVYDITNRPDLIAETASAIRAATLKAHHTDFYSRDIYEQTVQFDTLCYHQSFDLYMVASNYRAISYFRPIDSCTEEAVGPYVEIITPEEIFDAYGCNRAGVAYVAGRMLEIRHSVDFDKALYGYYVNPIVTPVECYASWIAHVQPYAIINEAIRVMFKMIGYDEQAAMYNRLVAEEYALLKIHGVADKGD